MGVHSKNSFRSGILFTPIKGTLHDTFLPKKLMSLNLNQLRGIDIVNTMFNALFAFLHSQYYTRVTVEAIQTGSEVDFDTRGRK